MRSGRAMVTMLVSAMVSVSTLAGGEAEPTAEGPSVFRVQHEVPFCREPPEIDGSLDDACWERSLRLGRFYYRHSGAPARVHNGRDTSVRVLFDEQNIYFGLRCEESVPDKLVALSTTRDQPDWGDDRVELFIDPAGMNGYGPVFYLSVNCRGVLHDSCLGGTPMWDPAVTVATGLEEQAYVLEIALPLAALGKGTIRGERWHINVGRFHRASYQGATSLVPLNRSSFIEAGKLAPLVFGQRPRLSVLCLSQGALRRDGFTTGKNEAVFEVDNRTGHDVELELAATNTAGSRELGCERQMCRVPSGRQQLRLYYRVYGDSGERLEFRVTQRDGAAPVTLFSSSSVLSLTAKPEQMAYRVTDPLYDELLVHDRPDAERIKGHAVWGQPVCESAYLAALQYGSPYSFNENGLALARAGYHLYIADDWWERYEAAKFITRDVYKWYADKGRMNLYMRMYREHGWSKPILYAHYSARGRDEKGRYGVAISSTHGWLPDPINQRAFLESVELALEKWGTDLWAVSMGDEQFAQNYHWGLTILEKQFEKAKPDSFLRRAHEEVKQKYGFGRFGFPVGIKPSDPDHPYCRRAYTTWLQDKLREVNRQVYELVKAKCPSVHVISEDGTGCPASVGVEYYSEHSEIASYQVHSTTSSFPPYAFRTKMVVDLCGMRNVWMVPHECDSGYSAGCVGADDQLALYSQIALGGATGIHSWPAALGVRSSSPPKAVSADTGYPLGWAYLLRMGEVFSELPPLRFPDSVDTAILVSNETVKCDPKLYGPYRHAFMHLGPLARGWFRFVSETQIELGRAALADYRIVYLPSIRYTRQSIVERLVSYVEGGGILVCGDPHALSTDISSAALTAAKEGLFGVRLTGDAKASSILAGGSILPVWTEHGAPQGLEVVSDRAEVSARLDTGAPAIVSNRVGSGRTVCFAWNPYNAATTQDPVWRAYLATLHRELGGSLGHDIWRFQFPRETVQYDEPEPPAGRCLTGNFAFWYRGELVDGGERYNIDTDGSYTIAAGEEQRTHAFAAGPLTNRLAVITHPDVYGRVRSYEFKEKLKLDEWCEMLSGPAPVTVTFSFPAARRVSLMRLSFSGELSGLVVETSRSGKRWRRRADLGTTEATGYWQVSERSLALRGWGSVRHVRLRIPGREEGAAPLVLAEVEIWGEDR